MVMRNCLGMVGLLLLVPDLAWALEGEGMICRNQAGEKAKPAIVRMISLDTDIIRLRFPGTAPDRFFSHGGKFQYTQFATKKNPLSPLVNQLDTKSTLKVDMRTGGTLLAWQNAGEEMKFACSVK